MRRAYVRPPQLRGVSRGLRRRRARRTNVIGMSSALPGPLVSTQWLADHLGAEELVVLDASVVGYTQPNGRPGYLSGHEQYLLEGHIPGAIFADVIEELSDPDGRYPFTRPRRGAFAAAVGALGIGNDTTVVVYDTAVGQWAARVWWLFRAFGYDDGRRARRRARPAGAPRAATSNSGTSSPSAPRSPRPSDPSSGSTRRSSRACSRGEHEAALVCAAPPQEFTGEVVTRSAAGTSPAAARLRRRVWSTGTRRTYLDRERARAASSQPALGAPRIVTYCGGGIAAASAALALTLLGEDSVAVYDGSLNEWAADPEAALVTTAVRVSRRSAGQRGSSPRRHRQRAHEVLGSSTRPAAPSRAPRDREQLEAGGRELRGLLGGDDRPHARGASRATPRRARPRTVRGRRSPAARAAPPAAMPRRAPRRTRSAARRRCASAGASASSAIRRCASSPVSDESSSAASASSERPDGRAPSPGSPSVARPRAASTGSAAGGRRDPAVGAGARLDQHARDRRVAHLARRQREPQQSAGEPAQVLEGGRRRPTAVRRAMPARARRRRRAARSTASAAARAASTHSGRCRTARPPRRARRSPCRSAR